MPTPVPATMDVGPTVERLRKSVKFRSKDKSTFHVKVGNASMETDALAENIEAVLHRVEGSLESGAMNIRSVYIKTSMDPAVRII